MHYDDLGVYTYSSGPWSKLGVVLCKQCMSCSQVLVLADDNVMITTYSHVMKNML